MSVVDDVHHVRGGHRRYYLTINLPRLCLIDPPLCTSPLLWQDTVIRTENFSEELHFLFLQCQCHPMGDGEDGRKLQDAVDKTVDEN